MAAKTLDSLPVLAPGEADCRACTRFNLRGGDNSCPIRELRDAPGGYAEQGTIKCASFKPLSRRQAIHRLGVQTHKHAERQPETLF